MTQQSKLLGHVIRVEELDLMRQPTINKDLRTPGVFTRRPGRPRLDWLDENCKWTYKSVCDSEWGENKDDCAKTIIEGARERKI